MTENRQAERIETVLAHVAGDRRAVLRHLLTAAGAVIALPMMTTRALAQYPDDECWYYERKIKKGKEPGEYSVEVKKKKCGPDEFFAKGKKGKEFDDWIKKGKKGDRFYYGEPPP
jgi:hypothetical protein